jgi:hypothetical protein
MGDDELFYRPDRTNEPAEPSMAELRERKALTDSIVRNMRLIAAVDLAELEVLQRRVAAIASDLQAIKDSDVVKELEAQR